MKKLIFFLLFIVSFSLLAYEHNIRVLASSSLTDVLSQIGKDFEKHNKIHVELYFDSSTRMAKQIFEGAQANIFFSADKEWNLFLQQKGLTTPEKTKDLLSNELVLIAPVGSKLKVENLKSLSSLKFKNISLPYESVPGGKYAYESLKKVGVLESISGKIVNGDTVRNVLSWVAKNEVDLAIVYKTDALAEKRVKILLEITPDHHSQIIYPASIIKEDAPTKAFYQFLQSEESKAIFKKAGFKVL